MSKGSFNLEAIDVEAMQLVLASLAGGGVDRPGLLLPERECLIEVDNVRRADPEERYGFQLPLDCSQCASLVTAGTPTESHRQKLAVAARLIASQLGFGMIGQVSALDATGVLSPSQLDERLRYALSMARRHKQHAYIYMVDFDRFVRINQQFGRQVGDSVLRTLAARMVGVVRQTDHVIHLHADRFVVITLQNGADADGGRVAQRLLDAVRTPVPLAGHQLKLTASVGLASWPADGADPRHLVAQAEEAMRRAKNKGGDTFEHVDPELTCRVNERLSLEADLRIAVGRDELTLAWQPLVDAAGRTVAAEALMRWNHPTRGTVSPGAFIPIAEQNGLIVPIGQWALRAACRQGRQWMSAGMNLCVAVNVSANQFAREDFVSTVRETLADTGLPPEQLELELTEGVFVHDTKQAADRIGELRKLGVGVAIDDFGTGYSCLAYLHKLPIDVLKIDRTFVSEIDTADGRDLESRTAIIRSIVSLARSLGLKVVAEGVETELQLRYLRVLGCELMQGYLFSKPVPGADLPGIIKKIEQARGIGWKKTA